VAPPAGPDDSTLAGLAARVGERLTAAGRMLATAESCTGGWVAKVVTDIPGSSAWFDRGFVTYTNAAKRESLGLDPEVIRVHGAVSEETVRAMAAAALARSAAQVTVAISGIAGPGGSTPDKPVGMVWFAWASGDGEVQSAHRLFQGDREAVRRQAVEFALEGVLERVVA
jgi:nicotinamide-nucleotide amidase